MILFLKCSVLFWILKLVSEVYQDLMQKTPSNVTAGLSTFHACLCVTERGHSLWQYAPSMLTFSVTRWGHSPWQHAPLMPTFSVTKWGHSPWHGNHIIAFQVVYGQAALKQKKKKKGIKSMAHFQTKTLLLLLAWVFCFTFIPVIYRIRIRHVLRRLVPL